MTLHRYGYVGGNPASHIDRYGYIGPFAIAIVFVAVFAGGTVYVTEVTHAPEDPLTEEDIKRAQETEAEFRKKGVEIFLEIISLIGPKKLPGGPKSNLNNKQLREQVEKKAKDQGANGNGQYKKDLPQQEHHFSTNKSTKWTAKLEGIAKKYDLDLDEPWNKEHLPHQGRHPDAYHEWVFKKLEDIDASAKGNKDTFLKLYEEQIKKEVREKPEMLRKEYWKDK